MKVMKFGGTSVGTPARMKEVASLITQSGDPTFVVLSAMSGTTNTLVEISAYLYKKNIEGANELINGLERKYATHIDELFTSDAVKAKMRNFFAEKFAYLRSFTTDLFTSFEEKHILAQGEMLSTHMMTEYLKENNIQAILLPALSFMRTDKNAEPNLKYIKEHLQNIMAENAGYQVYITQGFVCRNAYGEVDNLQRGGSDYTASLIGAAIQSEEVQIWTDIDGMHNNDPRIVEKTEAVRQLSFEEASELAYFGAKILHPTCIQPTKYAGIPVRLKNTMEPDAPGTIINNQLVPQKIKAIAAKDNIVAIKVKSSRMLGSAGFLRKVFEIFESYETPTDLIATSEVGVSITIEKNAHVDDIISELKKYGTVSVDDNMCIICVVGDLDAKNLELKSLATSSLQNIPVRMISYGGSNYNISFLIHSDDKKTALQSLQSALFGA